MRKIIASTYTTLDGFIDNPQLWFMQYSDGESQAYAAELLFGADALLLGRVTYEGMAASWPNMGGNPYGDRVNNMAKYVVSSTLDKAEWNNSTIIHGDDLLSEVAKLKEQPGENILIWGCGRLTDTLMEHGLLDEYQLWVCPVIRGEGQRLFRQGTKATLELADSTTFGSGMLVLTYRPTRPGAEAETAG
ncbi:dihydrofolate reductase family protein [Dactylosporangium darangshiense]|uniref:Dihydrofolate reductase family protein n=1 Tax=Dactylosporangium darangshiense TaxID=579108 RepID=A0ABP8DVT5_9ACTN